MHFEAAIVLLSVLFSSVVAIPSYASLAGMTREEVDNFARSNPAAITGALPIPPPQKDTWAKLVHDAAHPYKAPGSTDIRGPCPGLNTLANHGWLPRSGIATPQQIIIAVQDAFNMGNGLASLVTFGAHLVDGNQLTNLMSIGQADTRTGPASSNAHAGGLNTHGVFEGDASTTRGDFYFGDNHSFNETLFDQLVDTCNKKGFGVYYQDCAKEVRWNRIQDSVKRNPSMNFLTPRIFTAYAESIFPYRFFVDGRNVLPFLDLKVARGFFQTNTFPKGFYRRGGSFGLPEIPLDIIVLSQAHPINAGVTVGAGNYVEDATDVGINGGTCTIYTKHVTQTVPSVYPIKTTTGPLLAALKINLNNFFIAANSSTETCTQLFPYGK